MYRNSAQNFGQVKFTRPNALPSPDNTSDSDAELLDALEEKRRQLDEEISIFKAAKDREFREFEKELRARRKGSRASNHPGLESTATKQPTSMSGSAAVLNLLASSQNGSLNGRAGSKGKKDGRSWDKGRKPAPLSGPTLSLDRLNIAGETTPPLHSLGTPPSPTLSKTSRSHPSGMGPIQPTTPPQSISEKEPDLMSTPTPSRDRSDPFTGLFTPSYLPLLESRDQQPTVRTPPPLTSAEEEKTKLQLNADSKRKAERQKLESSQSLPPQPVSPTMLASMRAKSTPILPSASLTSALRTVSGGERARKHVMFQLADLKVVDPSSSYEEGPSPEMEERSHEFERYELAVLDEQKTAASERCNGSPRLLDEKEKKRSKGKGGRFGLSHSLASGESSS